jgi:hypothetical protein
MHWKTRDCGHPSSYSLADELFTLARSEEAAKRKKLPSVEAGSGGLGSLIRNVALAALAITLLRLKSLRKSVEDNVLREVFTSLLGTEKRFESHNRCVSTPKTWTTTA